MLNWDPNPDSALYYHGEDMRLSYGGRYELCATRVLCAFASRYDIFHFSNVNGMAFSRTLERFAERLFGRAPRSGS